MLALKRSLLRFPTYEEHQAQAEIIKELVKALEDIAYEHNTEFMIKDKFIEARIRARQALEKAK